MIGMLVNIGGLAAIPILFRSYLNVYEFILHFPFPVPSSLSFLVRVLLPPLITEIVSRSFHNLSLYVE